MTACVFLGPTLPVAQAREVLDVDYLPPVRQGDVYRAVKRLRPRAIGIVDGYFHQVPSVWHKEILWAMAEGVHVLGSASMGALRAAELEPFGMQGVGKVFAAFRDGIIEDDDEVAVIHGPPETGYLAASEAMVNIRRTLDDAHAQEIVGAATREALLDIAKGLHYPKREYSEMLARGASEGLPADELAALRAWLADGRVDQKREDAREMLVVLRDLLEQDAPPRRVDYRLSHTTMWAAATEDAVAGAHDDDRGRALQDWLIDELRLDGQKYEEVRRSALVRLLARREAQRRGLAAGDEERRRRVADFRVEHGLHRARDLDRWLTERDLDRQDLERVLADDALLDEVAKDSGIELDRFLVDALRTSGDYAGAAARAEAKRAALSAGGHDGDATQAMDDLRALVWYFEQHLGAPMPEDLDAYAARLGYGSPAAFRRAVSREYHFRQASGGADDPRDS